MTVLEAGPCPVTAVRTDEHRRLRRRPARLRRRAREGAHQAPSSATSRRPTRRRVRHLVEFRDEAGELNVGDTVTVEAFEVGDKVKIAGTSKGKGFQGTIKRHRFASGPKSHGSHNVRAPGSIGASATPSRVFKGMKSPGQMGNKRVTQKGLTVVEIIPDHNLLLVRGAVPGSKGTTVEVRTDG